MRRLFQLCFLLAGQALAAPVIENAGILALEAEDYTTNLSPRSAHEWALSNAVPQFSGTGYMEATPNSGANLNSTWVDTSPELQYEVVFSNAATYYVWIRGAATSDVNDSLHAGLGFTLPAATNSAANMTWQDRYNGCWVWTNRTTAGNIATLPVSAPGTNTFRLWMREDGMRVDQILLTTNAAPFPPLTGNAWHIPANAEPDAGMRVPFHVLATNLPVTFYNGNQFQGCGNAADQSTSTTFLYYKHLTNSTWTAVPATFHSQAGNNKYHAVTIPANTFNLGDVVQYYWRIGYIDRLPTFLHGTDTTSLATRFENVAQANPFTFSYGPAGSAIETVWGSGSDKIKARFFNDTGYLQIIGQSLDGFELGLTNTFLPGSATVGGVSYRLGGYVPGSFVPLFNGIQFRQTFGATSVVVRLTSPHLGVAGVVHYEVVDWAGPAPTATAIGGPSDAGEHFYGLGEKFNTFNQAGKKTRIITDDPPGDKGDKSYKVMPWFISTRGYGFHLDSSAESFFDLRAEFADRYVVSNLFSTLKFNIVAGPKLTEVLTRFTGYTGRPQMSPPWAFAPWLSSDRWANGGEVRYVLSKYREHDLPGSVFVFDSPWEIAYNDFTWNMTQFGNGGTFEGQFYAGFSSVSDMMQFLKTNGWKSVNWMTPFINTTSACCGEVPGQNLGQAANYAEGAASNYFVRASLGGPPLLTNWWKGTGSPIDFTNPDAVRWTQQQLSNLVAISDGVIGGFKTDDGESGNPPGSYIPKSAVYFDGRTGEEMQNGYATEYHKAVWHVLGTNGILFARSGFTGSQAFSGYWAGDNVPNFGESNGLPSVIVAGQSAAMCGYSTWGHDIGGYQNTQFSSTLTNLFMRWTQFGAFSPLMQLHRQVGSPVAPHYPWGYGAEALANYRFYTKLHTALFPYIYTYATEASQTGLPIIRPLVLLHQDDPNVYGLNHTYYFGNEMIIAPVITNTATTRIVYLPAGRWHDFFTNITYTGGQNIVWTNANQSQLPVFLRAGAIVPLISSNTLTLTDFNLATNALEFLVYPTTDSSFTVYDGTSVNVQTNGTFITANLTSVPRPIKLRVFAPPAAGAERDGVRLTSFTNANGFVEITFMHTGGATQIRFGPDSDVNGLPDSWEETWGVTCAACDADGDGFTNLQEYFAGTNPLDAANMLHALNLSPGGISFSSVLGMTYQVEMCEDLTNNSWSTLSNNIPGTGTVIPIQDLSATNVMRRFYRVRLLP
ncbi:MAG: hypothetical protein PCFJNLEI_02765 [Verrucomicrobiae bacterium]|nr:hypothetical protein [Verrucomicrobiae bacterium]